MIPFGNHAITLFHKNGAMYDRYVLTGCSWRSGKERSLIENAVVITETTICRMPPECPKPDPGDLLVLGVIDEVPEGEIALVQLMERLRTDGYRVFRIRSCSDNTGAPLAHYAATGA